MMSTENFLNNLRLKQTPGQLTNWVNQNASNIPNPSLKIDGIVFNPYLKVDPQSLQVVSFYRQQITSDLDRKLTNQTFPEISKCSRS